MCVCVIWLWTWCTETHLYWLFFVVVVVVVVTILVWRAVALHSLYNGARVSFMLITRIINDTRFVVIYRYFLDVNQCSDMCIYLCNTSISIFIFNLSGVNVEPTKCNHFLWHSIRSIFPTAFFHVNTPLSPGNWFILWRWTF